MPVQPMYFQPLSFQQANPILSGMQSVSQTYGNDMQAQFMRLRAQQLAAQLPYAGQQAQADLAYRQAQTPNLQAQTGLANAQTGAIPSEIRERMANAGYLGSETAKNNFALQHPELNFSGIAGQLAAIDYLQKHNPGALGALSGGSQQQATNSPDTSAIPSSIRLPSAEQVGASMPNNQSPAQPQLNNSAQSPIDNLRNLAIQSVTAPIQEQMARTQLDNQRISGAAFINAPPDAKRYNVAQATAFGLTPDDAVRQFMQGKSLADMAQEKGFGSDTSKWPTPDFMPTIASLSRNQQRQSAIAELNEVGPFIDNALGQYSQTIGGYSPQQVIDSFNSMYAGVKDQKERDDKLSDFLAATVVVPDYNITRARGMGITNIGVEAMQNVGKASMNDFKKFRSFVTPSVYVQTQTKANNLINKMNSAATKAVLVPYQNQSQNDPTGNTTTGTGSNTPTETKVLNGVKYGKINGDWHRL